MDIASKHPTCSTLAMHTENGVVGKLPGRCNAIHCIDSTILPRENRYLATLGPIGAKAAFPLV